MSSVAVYATKKKGESNERLMHRFKQMAQRKRHIIKAKKEKFFTKEPTKRFVRASAVMRSMHRDRRAKEKFYS